MVERLGVRQAPDMQVHMAHRRAWRRAVPAGATGGGDHALDVERVAGHGELTIVVSPGVARPIDVDLDAQAVRVGQIERLADQVIGHADANAVR